MYGQFLMLMFYAISFSYSMLLQNINLTYVHTHKAGCSANNTFEESKLTSGYENSGDSGEDEGGTMPRRTPGDGKVEEKCVINNQIGSDIYDLNCTISNKGNSKGAKEIEGEHQAKEVDELHEVKGEVKKTTSDFTLHDILKTQFKLRPVE